MSNLIVTQPDAKALGVTSSRRGRDWAWRGATLLVIALFLAIWELLPRLGIVREIILPPFSESMSALFETVGEPRFADHMRITLYEMLVGFVVGVLVGLAMGVPLALSPPLKRVTYPLVVAFQSVPKVVFVPLVITWFGYGPESKIALAVVISFFPVLINSMAGIASVPRDAIQLMRSFRASGWQIFRKVSLPHAAPIIFAGVETALTFAVAGTIVAEFIGASEGLGYLLVSYSYQLLIDRVFGLIILLSLIAWVLYAVVNFARRKIIFWESESE